MVLRASAAKRSAILSCARPKTRRKSLARNLPSLLAANAVIVFTGHLPAGKMLSFWEETERRKDAGQYAPPNLNAIHVLAGRGTFRTDAMSKIEPAGRANTG